MDIDKLCLKLRHYERRLFGFKADILWFNVFLAVTHHVVGAYWCYYYAFPVKWQTVLYAVFMYVHSGLGLTTGAHRYWTHRQFKAKLPLQILLSYLWCSAGQYKIRYWVLAHRMHHKFSDTIADPHDITRGQFFSHVGCLLLKPLPEMDRGETITDMSDIDNDKVVQFTDRHYFILETLACFILPTAFNVWMWGETWQCAIAWQCFIRYLYTFHAQMTINSLAHSYGTQDTDKTILARDNWFVIFVTGGEGYHNYHHTFAFDHKGADFPIRSITTVFIKFFAKIGWAYDLREPSRDMIKAHVERYGQVEHHGQAPVEEPDHWVVKED